MVKVFCPFTELPAPVKIWNKATSTQFAIKTNLWLINFKLQLEEFIRRKKRKNCCYDSRLAWGLTEANVLDLTLPCTSCTRCLHLCEVSEDMGCSVVFGLFETSQCRTEENSRAASLLHLLFPAMLCLCFYVRSPLHIFPWHWQTTSCLKKYADESVSAQTTIKPETWLDNSAMTKYLLRLDWAFLLISFLFLFHLHFIYLSQAWSPIKAKLLLK